MKIRSGKEETHSKGFPENITKFFRALNTPINITLEKTHNS